MVDFRPIAYVFGRILIVLAILMLIPAVVDWYLGDPNWMPLFFSALMTGGVGGLVALATENGLRRAFDIRQAYLLTAVIWFGVPAFGALPFMLGVPQLNFTEAYFEAVSGITTTGATVIYGLDEMPAGMNLWRGLLNAFGGLGIAFVAMIFLPVSPASPCGPPISNRPVGLMSTRGWSFQVSSSPFRNLAKKRRCRSTPYAV